MIVKTTRPNWPVYTCELSLAWEFLLPKGAGDSPCWIATDVITLKEMQAHLSAFGRMEVNERTFEVVQ